MPKIEAPARAPHPPRPRKSEPWLPVDLAPLAAQLVGTVRDYGPDDVARLLAHVPDGRHDDLVLVLAAMVDPDARPAQLLAWTGLGPVRSRDALVTDQFKAYRSTCPACGREMRSDHLKRHMASQHPDDVERAA